MKRTFELLSSSRGECAHVERAQRRWLTHLLLSLYFLSFYAQVGEGAVEKIRVSSADDGARKPKLRRSELPLRRRLKRNV